MYEDWESLQVIKELKEVYSGKIKEKAERGRLGPKWHREKGLTSYFRIHA
jgi:hypothetical protein